MVATTFAADTPLAVTELVAKNGIADKLPDVQSDTGFWGLLVDWLAGVACVMLCLFGAGKLIFGETVTGLSLLGGAVVLGVLIYWRLSRMKWEDWLGK